MKRLIFVVFCTVMVGLVAALLRWPLPMAQQNIPQVSRVRVMLALPPNLTKPGPTRSFLSFLGIRLPSQARRPDIGTIYTNVTSTGFASSPYQTDATPCRTATGNLVRPGTVASNFLPLGTLLEISVGGEKVPGVFIVEDRMADRFSNRIDIWFAQTRQALDFGKRHVEIMVVGYGKPGQPLAQAGGGENDSTVSSPAKAWEAVKLRVRFLAEFLTTRGANVNRFDVDCLELQQSELNL